MTIIEIITIKKIFPISQFLKWELIFFNAVFWKGILSFGKVKNNNHKPQLYFIFGNLFILFINFIVVKFKILYLTLN